eukprot:663612-Prorocentrum_lima.AAC.1
MAAPTMSLGLTKQDVIAWLDLLGDRAQDGPASLTETRQHGCGGMRYRVEALIEAVLLVDLVRNSQKLRETLQGSMRLYLGRQASALLEKLNSGACRLPDKSLISRYKLSPNVSYMKLVAAYFEKLLQDADAGDEFALYMLADSS